MKVKNLSILLTLIGVATAFADPQLDSMTDPRDGKVYRIVQIYEQIWMAENLNYETKNSFCYNDSLSNCQKYGRLYTWTAALNACPDGWHLPSEKEWMTLRENVGRMNSDNHYHYVGKLLKSKNGWNNERNGSDTYGFSVIPAGRMDRLTTSKERVFSRKGSLAYFWTSSERDSEHGKYVYFFKLHSMPPVSSDTSSYYNSNHMQDDKNYGYSVRCKNNVEIKNLEYE